MLNGLDWMSARSIDQRASPKTFRHSLTFCRVLLSVKTMNFNEWMNFAIYTLMIVQMEFTIETTRAAALTTVSSIAHTHGTHHYKQYNFWRNIFFSHSRRPIHKTHLTDEWNWTQLIIMKNTDTINTQCDDEDTDESTDRPTHTHKKQKEMQSPEEKSTLI